MTEDEIKAVWEEGFFCVVTDDPSGEDKKTAMAKRRPSTSLADGPNYVLMGWSIETKLVNTPDELLEAMKEIAPLDEWRVSA